MMNNPISPGSVAASLTEHWSPRVIAEIDDSFLKVAQSQRGQALHLTFLLDSCFATDRLTVA